MNNSTGAISQRQANLYVAILAALIALNLMDRQLLAIVAEPVKREFNFSDTELGALTGSVFAVVFAFASIPISWAADRFSRVGILTISATLWSLCTAAMGLVTGFQQLAITRVGLAISEAGCNPCAQSLIAGYVPVERRGRAMGVFALGVPAGFVIAAIAGGALTDALGWRSMFFVMGAFSLAAALVAAVILPEPARGSSPVNVAGTPKASNLGFRSLLRKPAFQNMLIATGLIGIASSGSAVFGFAFIVRYFGWTAGQAGAVFGSLIALTMFVGTWLGGRVSDHLRTRDARWPLWVIALALTIMTPFMLVGAFAPVVGVLFVTIPIDGFCRAFGIAPAFAIIQGLAPEDSRARAAASFGVVGNLVGLGAGPLIVGGMSDALVPLVGVDSLRYGLAVLVIPQLLGAFFLWRAAQTLEADLAD